MTTLTTARRVQSLESVFDRFEEAWHRGSEPLIDDFLDSEWEADRRQQVFDELLLIDLEHRWRRPRHSAALLLIGTVGSAVSQSILPARPKLEDYVARWPLMTSVERLPVGTILHEFRLRCEAGEQPELSEYLHRFPIQAELLRGPLTKEIASRPAVATIANAVASNSTSQGSNLNSSPASANRKLTPGEQVGRYRVLWPVGHGAMGMVYLAYDPDLDRQVAMKVPFLEGPHAERLAQRFRREAKLTASLRHPNICRVLDVDRQDGLDFLTMDYIEGTSLESLLKSAPLMPAARAAAIVRKIALALQEAHSAGIIHRDIKPSNILIDRRGEPVLTDFGLARRPDVDVSEQTRPGEWLGTPAYMAPEQFSGLAEDISPACDVFSLGVVFYRLLTGQRPFHDGHRREDIAKRQPPPPPSSTKPGVPETLSAICLRALCFQPQDRFTSAGDFAAALEPFAVETAIADPSSMASLAPTVPLQSVPTTNRASYKAVLTLAAGLIFVAAVVGWDSWRKSGGDPSSSRLLSVGHSKVTNPVSLESPGNDALRRLPRVELHVQRADQSRDYQVLGPELGALHNDDKVQFRVSLDEPAYVALFYVDSRGVVSRLGDRSHEAAVVSKELWEPPLAGPNELQTMHKLGGPAGMEFVFAVASPGPFNEVPLAEIERVRVQPIEESVGFSFVVDMGEPSASSGKSPRLTTLPLGADPRQFRMAAAMATRGLSGTTATRKSDSVTWEQFAERLVQLGDVAHGLAFHHAP